VADVEGKYEDLGFRTIADRRPGMGPLGGLQRALEDLEDQQEEEWLLLASCDLLGLRSAWINLLLSYRNESDTSIAFRGKQQWEPLPGLYRAWIHQQVQTQLDRGILPLWRLLEESASIPVPLPEGWDQVIHVNRKQDLIGYKEFDP
jgi:molybdopterin-guanine dinucleotide biosynthesis protein A